MPLAGLLVTPKAVRGRPSMFLVSGSAEEDSNFLHFVSRCASTPKNHRLYASKTHSRGKAVSKSVLPYPNNFISRRWLGYIEPYSHTSWFVEQPLLFFETNPFFSPQPRPEPPPRNKFASPFPGELHGIRLVRLLFSVSQGIPYLLWHPSLRASGAFNSDENIFMKTHRP